MPCVRISSIEFYASYYIGKVTVIPCLGFFFEDIHFGFGTKELNLQQLGEEHANNEQNMQEKGDNYANTARQGRGVIGGNCSYQSGSGSGDLAGGVRVHLSPHPAHTGVRPTELPNIMTVEETTTIDKLSLFARTRLICPAWETITSECIHVCCSQSLNHSTVF